MLDVIHHPPRKLPPACVLLPQGTRKEHPDRHGERQTPVKHGEDLVSFLIFPWVSLILGEANNCPFFLPTKNGLKKRKRHMHLCFGEIIPPMAIQNLWRDRSSLRKVAEIFYHALVDHLFLRCRNCHKNGAPVATIKIFGKKLQV